MERTPEPELMNEQDQAAHMLRQIGRNRTGKFQDNFREVQSLRN